MITRVDLYFKQRRPTESNASRMLRMIRMKARDRPFLLADEQAQWLSDNNIPAELKEDSVDHYLLFDFAEDALAFKLTFGL